MAAKPFESPTVLEAVPRAMHRNTRTKANICVSEFAPVCNRHFSFGAPFQNKHEQRFAMLRPQWRRAAWRGVLASPFLAIAIACYVIMNTSKMEQLWQPFLDSSKISWNGGSIPILTTFYHNEFLDSTWRPFTVLFSPAALGYDPVSWWLSFSFMHNLAPLHGIWIAESYRLSNRSSPAHWPTIFTVLGNFIGTGTATPLFYFLCFTFGPTAEDVLREQPRGRARTTPFILPLMLLFYTSGTCIAHLAPSLETRHYFTWTWQFLPLWVGLGNILLTRTLPRTEPMLLASDPSSRLKRYFRQLQRDEMQLGVLAGIAGGVWLWMIYSAPYSLAEILFPPKTQGGNRWIDQQGFTAHARLVLQIDNLCAFAASFLWFGYQRAETYWRGDGRGSLPHALLILLPLITIALGPGVSVLLLWMVGNGRCRAAIVESREE